MLLVGGESRRMGADKATLEIAGEPLWQRQLHLLRELQPEALWVSARVRPAWCPPDVETVLDRAPSCGPLSGLAAGLDRLETSHLLALAVDLPFMTVEHLRKLRSLIAESRGVLPLNGDIYENLCAIYPREAAAVARQQLKGDDHSVQMLVRSLAAGEFMRSYLVPNEEIGLYRNINRPDQVPRGPI
jgi:molybdopterin-guanine dinucleotide biosynthesis protein A